ncbi:hypothetical protein F8568_001995 [Actinomadura sp. LD22]|uniref:Uncharacterized protein n=1 Tax=Actinomadura physcomitrii TaxID=2650748 RepID=A0A6I4LZX2_9ACTN|nr:hypothetical protein [Actinomadura physcomitrii]MVZ99177.1 hypothetical protein [Actinomadura physcomitrii]
MVLLLSNSIAEARTIRLRDLESAPSALDGYPHKYVVIAHKSWLRRGREIPTFCAAVERLEPKGWEPVSWNLGARRSTVVLRRNAPDPS